MPTFIAIIQHFTGILAREIRHEKEIKVSKFAKKEVKLFLFYYNMSMYTEHPTETTRQLLQWISEVAKIAGYKINTYKSICLQKIHPKRIAKGSFWTEEMWGKKKSWNSKKEERTAERVQIWIGMAPSGEFPKELMAEAIKYNTVEVTQNACSGNTYDNYKRREGRKGGRASTWTGKTTLAGCVSYVHSMKYLQQPLKTD